MRTHVWRFDVEWPHCDAAGIVFYPNFYIWFDMASGRLFKANRLSYPELKRDFGILGMPLLETGAKYENPCRLDDTVELTSWVEEWSGRTFLVKHRLVHADGRPAMEGFERRALIKEAPGTARGVAAVEAPLELKARFSV